jgi:hypothetical protein
VPVDTTLTWSPGDYATQYRIQVSADTFATFAHNTIVGSASFTVNLDYLTLYQWRVRSVNNSGLSAWSDTLAFVTQSATRAANRSDDHVADNLYHACCSSTPTLAEEQ